MRSGLSDSSVHDDRINVLFIGETCTRRMHRPLPTAAVGPTRPAGLISANSVLTFGDYAPGSGREWLCCSSAETLPKRLHVHRVLV